MDMPNNEIDVVALFYDGLWNAAHQKRLREIGNELNKVRNYSNERNTDADLFSQTIVHLTLSSYFAGLVPIVRIESSLFVEKEFRNEYAYALAVRAYIEVAGRLHKGMRLWQQFQSKKKTLEEFRAGVVRLTGKFQARKDSSAGIFKGKGFNVVTLVESLKNRIPDVIEKYELLSNYVHGDFKEQMWLRKESWISELQQKPNPVIAAYEKDIEELRKIVFEDFEELLRMTQPLRVRYDNLCSNRL